MKQFFGFLLACCLLAGLITLSTPTAQAAEHTDHCVCGGSAADVGDHTECEAISWKPLSSVATLSKVNFGKIPSGNYYLDGDVTISGWSTLGKVSSNALATQPALTVQLQLCLNGHSITSPNRIFGAIYMGSVLSICDCSGKQAADGSWSWAGSMSGGGNVYGGIIYGHAGSRINVYGGNITGRATDIGGAFVIAGDSGGDVDDNGIYDEADKNDSRNISCQFNFYNGVITGNSVKNFGGTICLMHTATMNMYGGTVTGGTSPKNGGNIHGDNTTTLNIQGGTIQNGTAAGLGGNIYKPTKLTLINATVANGTASEGGNIYTKTTVDLTANNIYGGYPEAVRVATVQDGQTVLSQEYSLAEALTHLTENSYLKLMRDLTAETEISGTVYLDMNGHDLTGVTVTGTVYGFDSATDSYEGDQAGRLSCTVNGGQIIAQHKADESLLGAIRRYLTVQEEDTYSFHRFYIGITAVTLRPGKAGMGYKATFAGDEAVKNYLSGSKAYGYQLWIHDTNKVSRGYNASKFGGVQELTLVLNNILSQSNDLTTNSENAQAKIHAVAYIQTADGQRIESTQVSYDFKDMIQRADAAYADYNTTQQAALQSLSADFSETMMSWDIANTHHADGSMWEKLDMAGFRKKRYTTSYKLSENTTYTFYCLPEGNYVLTEDWNLSGNTLGILPDTKIRICLNGHKITSSSRTLRIIGQIDLCDCHPAGQEGTVTSTYNTFAPVFYVYHSGQFDIYGGNLYTAGSYAHSGVGAISHDGGTLNADKAPGIINMYGGSISSGGTTSGNGGLISMWNGSTFNMYGGELYGGTAQNGGALHVTGTCTFNMYGGTLRENTATETGGAINLTAATSTFNMYGGSITGNTAPQGGAVYSTNTPLHLGGSITGNSSGVDARWGSVELSGLVKITDNTDYDLELANSNLEITGLDPASRIGLAAKVRGYLCDDTSLAACFLPRGTKDLIVREYNGKLMLLPENQAEFSSVDTFSVGYSTVCSNPENPVGLPLAGYGNTSQRLSKQVIDDLYTSVVAMSDENNNTVLLYTCDIQRIPDSTSNNIRRCISLSTGVPFENIFISSTHTHSAPDMNNSMQIINEYAAQLTDCMVQIALEAMADRRPATAQQGAMEVEKMNFVRHYYYFDENGEKQYCGDNFGVYPSDKSAKNLFHATKGDHSLQVIRFVRDGKDVVLANWSAHPHFTGGSNKYDISSDFVGPMRDAVQTNEDCHFAFIQGCGGNMNETSNITGEHRYSNSINPNNTARTLYGQKMAEYVSQVLDSMTAVPTGLIQTDTVFSTVPINHTEDDKVAQAQALQAAYYVWKDKTFPAENNGKAPNYTQIRDFCMSYGFQSIYHAGAVIGKAGRDETAQIETGVFSIGNSLGFYSGPGELWSDTALEIKGGSPFAMTFTVGYTNQSWNYFPDGDAATVYDNYEKQLSHLLFPDATEILKAYWHEALDRLYENAQ